jgi:putative membrane-bound dehydrogenase-like protein
MTRRLLCSAVFSLLFAAAADAGMPLKILFLGDNGHHRPAERYRQIEPVLSQRGIELVYADTAKALNADTLSKYAGLLVYANIEKITPEQEKALLDYVAAGKGFIPIHCASFCFLNSPKYVELVGAQFQKHGTGVFRTTVTEPDHPVMKGYRSFESWDETYVHTRHNTKDRVVLEHRDKEPWTWVRTHGKGRVFYTAWGHDQRTWGNEGFQELLERGIRWACGDENPRDSLRSSSGFKEPPEMTSLPKNPKPFEYVEAKVPFYPAGKKWGTISKTTMPMQRPVDAVESMKHMVHPVDFEVKLFASEPDIKRPICMNWDERGRLWIVESVDYPNELKRKGEGRDRLVICEDTDGDGRADKFKVFADKLSIPTSFVFYRKGVIVMQAPDTLYLADNDGDEVCDERTVLFTGWNTYDTHAGPSNLVWGFDNWIYGICGYSGFNGTVGDERHSFKQGFFRFKVTQSREQANAKPQAAKLEFLRSTNNNSWGVGFSEDGLLFGSTANGNPSMYLPIPNRYYEAVRGWSSEVLGGIAGNAPMHPITDKVRQVDYHGRFTAGAGHALYTARTYPKNYWNRTAFVCEPTGHLVATFVLDRQGADFRSRNAWNLLASDDEWTSPIMAEVGPDGNVWIIDWYNYIVQHNPTPAGFKTGKGAAYETPLRDKTHGRIYRLVMKNQHDGRAGGVSPPSAQPEALVATLNNDNLLWRKHAQRLLIERGDMDVTPALVKLARNESVDEIGLNVGAIHALWTLKGLGVLDVESTHSTVIGYNRESKDTVLEALKHKSPGVRRAAVQVLPREAWSAARIFDSGILSDSDDQVRLAALLTLAEISDRNTAVQLVRLLQQPDNLNDPWLPDAITAAAAACPDSIFLSTAAVSKQAFAPRARQIIGTVAEHYARGAPTKTVAFLFSPLSVAHPETAEVIIAGLAKGWPQGKTVEFDGQAEAEFNNVLSRLPNNGRADLLKLAVRLGHRGIAKQLAETTRKLLAAVADEDKDDAERLAAAKQAVDTQPGDDDTTVKLLAAVTPRSSPALATGLIDALSASQASGLGAALVKKMPSLSPAARAAAVRVLLSRSESILALIEGVDQGKIQLTELSLDQKQALADHPNKKIAFRARRLMERGGGLPSADRQKVLQQLEPLVAKTGDPAAGKLAFKKHCAACHTHSGEGTKIGPDLTGMAVHPKHELLVQIIDPSRSVEGNYRLYQVLTEDGRSMNGLLASETKTSLELYDSQGKKHILQREDVAQLIATPKSLMPDGFEKTLSETELIDLLEFLTQRGKFLPLALAKAANVISTRGMFYSEDAPLERLIFKDWGPKEFEGVPFHLVDPEGERTPNAIMLYGPQGKLPPKMPKSVSLVCNAPAKAIHLLSGVSGWGFPYSEKGSLTMTVRLHYKDGATEDHELKNGEHFADYIRRVDVPGSKFAFALRGQQLRFLSVLPRRDEVIERIELVKGTDITAPVVMAVTVETR